jgi:hypothetical protein
MYSQSSFYISVSEKNLDKKQEFSLIKSNLIKTLNKLNFSNVSDIKKQYIKLILRQIQNKAQNTKEYTQVLQMQMFQ